MRIILEIYFGLNCILCGLMFGIYWKEASYRNEKINVILFSIIALLFGIIIVMLLVIFKPIQLFFNYLDGIWQIRFFFCYYVLRRPYKNRSIEVLERVNNQLKLQDEKSIKYKMMKIVVEKVNKINNYIPEGTK